MPQPNVPDGSSARRLLRATGCDLVRGSPRAHDRTGWIAPDRRSLPSLPGSIRPASAPHRRTPLEELEGCTNSDLGSTYTGGQHLYFANISRSVLIQGEVFTTQACLRLV